MRPALTTCDWRLAGKTAVATTAPSTEPQPEALGSKEPEEGVAQELEQLTLIEHLEQVLSDVQLSKRLPCSAAEVHAELEASGAGGGVTLEEVEQLLRGLAEGEEPCIELEAGQADAAAAAQAEAPAHAGQGARVDGGGGQGRQPLMVIAVHAGRWKPPADR